MPAREDRPDQRRAAGPRHASTKNANSRSNALGVDSVRSGWHWTAIRNGPPGVSKASTTSPSELADQADGEEPGCQVGAADGLVVVAC